MSMEQLQEERARLLEYANTLAAAGFEVWHGASQGSPGYLVYRNASNGCWGTFQRSYFDGWQHLMPIKPSREHGSAMYLDRPIPPWTVAAARQCAQPTNRNDLVGRHANYGGDRPASYLTRVA